jgi:hypothetical protein
MSAIDIPVHWFSASPITGLDDKTTIKVTVWGEDPRTDEGQDKCESNMVDEMTTGCNDCCSGILVLVLIAPLMFLAISPILFMLALLNKVHSTCSELPKCFSYAFECFELGSIYWVRAAQNHTSNVILSGKNVCELLRKWLALI